MPTKDAEVARNSSGLTHRLAMGNHLEQYPCESYSQSEFEEPKLRNLANRDGRNDPTPIIGSGLPPRWLDGHPFRTSRERLLVFNTFACLDQNPVERFPQFAEEQPCRHEIFAFGKRFNLTSNLACFRRADDSQ